MANHGKLPIISYYPILTCYNPNAVVVSATTPCHDMRWTRQQWSAALGFCARLLHQRPGYVWRPRVAHGTPPYASKCFKYVKYIQILCPNVWYFDVFWVMKTEPRPLGPPAIEHLTLDLLTFRGVPLMHLPMASSFSELACHLCEIQSCNFRPAKPLRSSLAIRRGIHDTRKA